ncbi:helix-turn-helix domain-containing protein [Nocardioides sp. TRM66260-LWL]|uniref:helix-turn-helix domain-containing protein n=1 Tax=Nocardioides sp. TRM66260-LWL TaxID=2874478 RepID=UPI001CC49FFB|nr:helix-turn-helix domain-containing protein [Nocardioides sp. TRM66260-LWL]MBZ5734437.1 helix-turn-helix domain-containing protein [Nocardioides sp. TRM66260-LWL]
MDDGLTVQQLRRRAGLTQRQLAELSGVSQPNIAAYETGRRRPSPRMLARLDEAARPRPSRVLDRHRGDVRRIAALHRALDVQVFGSVARGEDRPGSDLDLLVTFAPDASLFDQAALVESLEDLLGVRVDVVSVAGLRPGHERIRAEARPL